ncbi:MAG TPA: Trm112 family protein [Planctomycetota bacterium]|nr:Trm112 family protein [Planctomycetota bacterium]
MIDEKLLAILACPVCRAHLRLEEQGLICTKTQVRYPVEDDIPILLADRAEPRHPDEVPGNDPPPQ